ncbi:hypothetical protein [Geodermatophilus sp. DSM 44513]|uniref:hypothetical protein n=1 Tax=Geodermatophilus sp. DSM 44513 TaxID=1528104 RepID=UPI0012861C03|nr:hypothetical protein [Geodermatophilus sp. DSM 44513]WNV74265.1 hypothetical protein RTG05_14835 [Geodermatophilus sp. DSM 44513]
MSVSAVVAGSPVVNLAFRQVQVNSAQKATSLKGEGPGGTEGAESDGLSAIVKALKKQMDNAQKELQRLVETNADEQAIRLAKQKVQMCASALASALTKQAEAEKAAQQAATGDQYM